MKKPVITIVVLVILALVTGYTTMAFMAEKPKAVMAHAPVVPDPTTPSYCKDGVAQTPIPQGAHGDVVVLCAFDLAQLQNKLLVANNLQLQLQSLQAQFEVANKEIAPVVDGLFYKYGVSKDTYVMNQQLAFAKKGN